MAELTSKSSASDRAIAAAQYKAALKEYEAWRETLYFTNIVEPAVGSLPAETVIVRIDPATNSQVTLGYEDTIKEQIASKYDYVFLNNRTVDPTTGSADIGPSQFAIRGDADLATPYIRNTPTVDIPKDQSTPINPSPPVDSSNVVEDNPNLTPVDVNDVGAGRGVGAAGAASGAGLFGDDTGTVDGEISKGGTISVGGTGSAADAGGTGRTPNRASIALRSNPLHEYVNHTYNISWYMLDPSSYNNFVLNGSETGIRSRPILRSGGFNKTNSSLDFDLSLNSLRFTSVIASSVQSLHANNFNLEMQVVEPYGVSLIKKLRDMMDTFDPNGEQFQLPYLIEIKWLGYDDKGNPQLNLKDTGPKLIVCQIINITFNITSAGTVYDITLAPYSQSPLNAMYGAIRNDVNLYGGTLEEVLKGKESEEAGSETPSLKYVLNKMATNAVTENRAKYADTYDFEIVSYLPNDRTAPDTSPTSLANSKLTYSIEDGETTLNYQKAMRKLDPTKQHWPQRGGSLIKDIIVDIAKRSRYFSDKVRSAANTDKENPLELVKIIPTVVKIGKFDSFRGTYQKDIVYKVVPYYLYGEAHPNLGQAPVGPNGRGFIKEYNWLFTGKNQDVLNVNLNYNLAYFKMFEQQVMEKSYVESGSNPEIAFTSATNYSPYSFSMPSKEQGTLASGSISQPAAGGDIGNRANTGWKTAVIYESFDQLLNSNTLADLITLDLDIIGDPDWISQDRSIRPIGVSVDANNNGFVDQQLYKGISVDVDGVYVNVLFRTPRDYNDATGLMQLDSRPQALISGIYRVIMVDSIFEGGVFRQTLKMNRLQNQEENKIIGSSTVSAGLGATSTIDARVAVETPGTVSSTASGELGATSTVDARIDVRNSAADDAGE